MSSQKVFCIGFQKTGTSTLRNALEILGYTVTDYGPFRRFADDPEVSLERIWEVARPLAHRFDAAQDTPWPLLYRHLDREFPDARFIHVLRDEGKWIKSVCRDFAKHHNEIHRMIYGSSNPLGHEAEWLAVYRAHNADVAAHFADAPDRYLKLEMGGADYCWDRICAFLEEPIPDAPWPHVNKAGTKERKAFMKRNLNRLKRLMGRAG